MSQEPVLYARSLKDNIAYGLDEGWDMEVVHQAAIKANAHIFIGEMKEKYDTQAGEKGTHLSGGRALSCYVIRGLFLPSS